MITTAKDGYFASLCRKLSNPNISIKTYWPALNRIINKKNVSNVPPLLENGVFVTKFQEKANIFNYHFVQHCSFNINESVLPGCCVSRCNKLLEPIDINVLKIIRAHSSIVRRLCLFYKECLETDNFPVSWKNASALPIHKKESRELKKITDQHLCYQFVGKFLKNAFLTPCINVLTIISS